MASTLSSKTLYSQTVISLLKKKIKKKNHHGLEPSTFTSKTLYSETVRALPLGVFTPPISMLQFKKVKTQSIQICIPKKICNL